MLVAKRPSNMLVYLRDGSAQTIARAATLRLKWQVKLSTPPSHSTLTPGQPVPGLSLYRQAPGRIAIPVSPALDAEALTTRPPRRWVLLFKLLQDCPIWRKQRHQLWPKGETTTNKLWGPAPHQKIPGNMWTEGLSTADRPLKKLFKDLTDGDTQDSLV